MTSFGQLITKQIAFGAKGRDSVSGVTTKYYYLDYQNTRATGLVKAITPITLYEILCAQVMVTHPLVYTRPDSIHFTWELSIDNTNWIKWTHAGATNSSNHTQYRNGGPKEIGYDVRYLYGDDLVSVAQSNGGAVWYFNSFVTPYVRLKCERYVDSCASYVNAYVTLKRLQ